MQVQFHTAIVMDMLLLLAGAAELPYAIRVVTKWCLLWICGCCQTDRGLQRIDRVHLANATNCMMEGWFPRYLPRMHNAYLDG